MTTYLTNAFSPSMLTLPADVSFKKVEQKEFCDMIDDANNTIGHSGTVDFVNKLCGVKLQTNRVSIKAKVGDTIYIVMLTFRLEEGKVLDFNEVKRLYGEGKVMLLKATIFGSVLEDLRNCEGRCDETEYDHLAHVAGHVE